MRPMAMSLAALPLILGQSYNNSNEYTSGALGTYPSQTYRSSNVNPPAWNWNRRLDYAPLPGYILSAPRGSETVPDEQQGPMLFDWNGELVWSGAQDIGQTMAFEVFPYNGSSVIAVWQGSFQGGGYGNGHGLVLDHTYKTIAKVNSTFDSGIDFHEFVITPNGTALITSYGKVAYNLSAFGVQTEDPSGGYILQGHFEEIDIATGRSLFKWSSINHVHPNMSYADPGSTGTDENNAWDYFHINSVAKDKDGHYLISARHTHAFYQIDKTDGHVIWEMNGKRSTWNMGDNTGFEWQHDARWHSDFKQISLFDNGATDFAPGKSQSRGMVLDLNIENMSASLALEMFPYNHTASRSQGNMARQPNGNWLIGWGAKPYVSEYDPNGTMLWSTQFGVDNTASYRAFRANWTGYPTTSPNISIANNTSTSSYEIYVSWNGATEVRWWHLFHGPSDDGQDLIWLRSADRTGFETFLSVPTSIGPEGCFQVMAANNDNQTLGFTDFVSAGDGSRSPAVPAQSSSIPSQSPSQTSSLTPIAPSGGAKPLLRPSGWSAVLSGIVMLLCGSVVGAFVIV